MPLLPIVTMLAALISTNSMVRFSKSFATSISVKQRAKLFARINRPAPEYVKSLEGLAEVESRNEEEILSLINAWAVPSDSFKEKDEKKTYYKKRQRSLPDETLYIIDGTSMLFNGYFSRESQNVNITTSLLTSLEDMQAAINRNDNIESSKLIGLESRGLEKSTSRNEKDSLETSILTCTALVTMSMNLAR